MLRPLPLGGPTTGRLGSSAAASSRSLSTLRLPQVVAHAHNNLPHHRHPHGAYEGGLPPLPLANRRRRAQQQQQQRPGAADNDDAAALPGLAEVQSIAAWLRSGELQQALAAQRPQLLAALQARVAALCGVLARAYAQASAAWRYVLACWPAWRASLQHDAEVVMEIALGLLPAWLAAARASVAAACGDLLAAASPHVAPLTAATAAALRAARQDAQRLRQAVEERVQAASARPAPARPPPRPTPPPLQQQPPTKHAAGDEARLRTAAGSKGAKVEVACGGLFWFGGSAATANAKSKSNSSNQGALATLQQLQDSMTAQSDALLYNQRERPRRWKAPQRRGWADDVVSRALARGSMPGSSVAQPPGGPWRLLHYGRRQQQQQQQQHNAAPLFGLDLTGLSAAPGAMAAAAQRSLTAAPGAMAGAAQRSVTGLTAAPEAMVAAAQRGVTGLVAKTQAVTARGAEQCRNVLAAPLQLARAPQAPTVLASLAAASLLAGAVAQALQHTRDQTTQQQLQQQASQKQEALRAQKARILGALQQSQAADAAGPNGRKRTPAFEAAAALGTAATAGGGVLSAASADDAQDAADDSGLAGADQLAPQELDPEAAALWKQFLSGSRTVGVPMWDNHVREDVPTRVSQREVERQTLKIRSAVAGQDSAALEEADMEQLNQQLQALTAAPMGRAARAAWLREKKEHEAEGDDSSQEEAASRKRSASRADNPFVISPEARAQWDADDDADGSGSSRRSAQPVAAAAGASAPDAGRPPSRPASRGDSSSRSSARHSARGDSPGGNPFAVAGEVRARWEAEDSEYSDATPRSRQQSQGGGLLGGLRALLGGGDRRGGGSSSQPARQQRPQQQRRRSTRMPPAGADGGVLEVPLPLPGVEGAARKKARVAAPAAADGSGGLVEGSPESGALRSEMLKAGAARRTRLQQQQQQKEEQAPAASSGSSSEAVPLSWRRAAADDASATSSSSSDLAAAVSMQDALDVTVEPRVVTAEAAPASEGAVAQQAATPANRAEEMVKRDTSLRL